MDEQTGPLDGQLPLHGVGDRLRMGREAAGMTLTQLSAETRIPERHLALMEKGEWSGLPARTYATGFARTYAKVVGLDDRVIVEDVETDPLFAAHRELAREQGFRAVHTTPLVTRGGECLGTLSIHYREPRRPSDRSAASTPRRCSTICRASSSLFAEPSVNTISFVCSSAISR